MTNNLFKVSVILTLTLVICSSCVSRRYYADLLQNKDRLDAKVERSHKDIQELKELKLTLEDQVKAKNRDITKLEKQVTVFKRQNEEMDSKFSVLNEQMKELTNSFEAKKFESASLISNYENKITELQISNNTLSTRLSSRTKKALVRKAKTKKMKIYLPAS